MGPIDNKSALVQVMAWRRTGYKPLPEPMLAQFTDAYMGHQREMAFRVVPIDTHEHGLFGSHNVKISNHVFIEPCTN